VSVLVDEVVATSICAELDTEVELDPEDSSTADVAGAAVADSDDVTTGG
jgi:hypothetical protein